MEIFSTIDLVNQCLIDEERVKAFSKALKKYVTKKSRVLDLGTGSGILSLLAAKYGANKITAIEIDPYLVDIVEKVVKENSFQNKISVINGDATKIKLNSSKKFDVVIAEMITTGMIDEPQVLALNNLIRQGLINKNTRVIPSRISTFVSLVDADFKAYGFSIPMVKHMWKQYPNNPKFKRLSNETVLNSYNFRSVVDKKFNSNLKFSITNTGTINGLILRGESWLTERIKLNDTTALQAPVIVPIDHKKVNKGQRLRINIKYIFGEGYQNLEASYI